MNYIALDPTDHLYWMGMKKLLWENSQPSMDQSLQVGCFWGFLKGNPCLPLPVQLFLFCPILFNMYSQLASMFWESKLFDYFTYKLGQEIGCLHTHARTHACMCTYVPPLHTHTFTHMHTCMHVHACAHTHSLWCWPIFNISGESEVAMDIFFNCNPILNVSSA